MAETVHIARKRVGLESAVETVRARLLAARRHDVNAADVAELTGLPLGLCEPALVELCARYPSRLVVRAGGSLAFSFYSLTRARGPGRWARARAAVAAAVARWRDRLVLAITYLLGPPFVLVASAHVGALMATAHDWPMVPAIGVYVVAGPVFFVLFTAGFLSFVLMQFFPLLSLVLLGIGFGLPLLPFFTGSPSTWWARLVVFFVLAPVCFFCAGAPGWLVFKMARDTMRAAFSSDGQSTVHKLWTGIGGLLFGPDPQLDDPLREERRVVALIRRLGGVVTDGDLMALFGWDRWQASSEFARVVADYGGEVVVDDAGTVVYRFDPLLRSEGAHGEADTRPAVERDAPPRLFGCAPGFATCALVSTALALAGLAVHPELRLWPTRSMIATMNPFEALGAWPYLPLVAMVLVRVPLWGWQRAAWRRRRRFLDVLTAALAHPEGVDLPQPSPARLRLCVRLGGEIDPAGDADGARRMRFPELARERDAAAALRASLAPPPNAPPVYVADDAQPDSPPDAAPPPGAVPSPSAAPSPGAVPSSRAAPSTSAAPPPRHGRKRRKRQG